MKTPICKQVIPAHLISTFRGMDAERFRRLCFAAIEPAAFLFNAFPMMPPHHHVHMTPNLALALATWLMLLVASAGVVHAAPQTARPADAFVESIGICTHLGYDKGPYGRIEDVIKPRLAELGIRHLREGFVGASEGGDANLTRKINDFAALGYRFTLSMRQPMEKVTGYLKGVGQALDAVEGPNETDLSQFKFSYKGLKFPEATRAYQEDLYQLVKGFPDPKVSALPVIQASMGWGGNAKKLGDLSMFADCGNTHAYTEAGDAHGSALGAWHLPHARIVTPGKPLWSTETGQSVNAVNAAVQAKVVPRIVAEHFRRGLVRTYLYELIDAENSGGTAHGGFGLLDYEGTPRPSFHAIKNVLSLLKDPGAAFTPAALDYTLTGADAGGFKNVQSVLLQKRDGRFYLVIWQEVRGWNAKTKRVIENAPQAVTLTLKTAVKSARLFSQDAAEPLETKAAPSELTLKVPDSLMIVELTPAS